jgi:hypothetical protein
MALLGQASGGWTESSSALRILNLGIRNSIGVATDDAFTQANPVGATGAAGISDKVDVTKVGVLSGSVAFTRPDQGSNYIGGPGTAAIKAAIAGDAAQRNAYFPVGFFINSAAGNPYENTPGVASGVLPYVSGMGTYGNALYETAQIATGGAFVVGTAIVYTPGIQLISSLNGFLMPRAIAAGNDTDTTTMAAEPVGRAGGLSTASTTLGILKMAPDAVMTELVFDARV